MPTTNWEMHKWTVATDRQRTQLQKYNLEYEKGNLSTYQNNWKQRGWRCGLIDHVSAIQALRGQVPPTPVL